MVGLQYLFLEPNADDPLNKGMCLQLIIASLSLKFYAEAAAEMSKNRDQFIINVKKSMGGGIVKGFTYDRVLV